ncbi:MAG: thioesterase family protein [Rhizobiaceae bacterium]|nr:thioesterase family protein [Rhizobiaceae bacterium]
MTGAADADRNPYKAPSPFAGFRGTVLPDWIDANRHMNVAWYDHVFDKAESALFAAFGVDEDYIARTNHGMFRLEKHIRYEKELVEGDELRIDSRIDTTDGRLLKHFHELWSVSRNMRAATARYVSIHVDLSERKAVRVTDPLVVAPLREMASAHAQLPAPDERRK